MIPQITDMTPTVYRTSKLPLLSCCYSTDRWLGCYVYSDVGARGKQCFLPPPPHPQLPTHNILEKLEHNVLAWKYKMHSSLRDKWYFKSSFEAKLFFYFAYLFLWATVYSQYYLKICPPPFRSIPKACRIYPHFLIQFLPYV